MADHHFIITRRKFLLGGQLFTLTLLGGGFPLMGKGDESLVNSSPQTWQTGPFLCTAEYISEDVAPGFQSVFECYQELAQRFSFPEMGQKVAVRIFPDDVTWRRYYESHYHDMSYRRSLYVPDDKILKSKDKHAEIYLYLSPRFGEDLRHESMHAYLYFVLKKNLPLWLEEGIAEYYEAPANRLLNTSWFSRTLERIKSGQFQKLKRMEGKTNPANLTRNDYCDSWAWINFFFNGPRHVQNAFKQYIAELRQKKLFYSSLSKALSKSGIHPEEELSQWFLTYEES